MTMLPDEHTSSTPTASSATTLSTSGTTRVPPQASPSPALSPPTFDSALTTTPASPASPVTTPSGATTPPVTLQDTQSAGTQQGQGKIARIFQLPLAFPILAQGVSVYTLWNRAPIIPNSFPRPPIQISWDPEKKLGSWYAIHLIWKPDSDTAEAPWLGEAETTQVFTAMLDYLDKLAAAQVTSDPGGGQQAQPVFSILHLRELKIEVPRLYRLRSYRPRYYKSKQKVQQEVFYTRRAFVLALQEQFGLLEEDRQDGELPSAFEHYDRDLHSRGWIIIHPSRALLVGVSDKAARILVNLLQRRDLDPPGRAISLEHYEGILGRLGLWNSTQEVGETMDQLESMVRSGNRAISGQVLIGLVLALIGAVLSIYAIVQPKNWEQQLWISLGILFVASLFFWCYARFGAAMWLWLGWLAIVVTLLFDTTALWLGPLMHFLSLLHL